MTTSNVTLQASGSRTADGASAALDCNAYTDINVTLTAQSPAGFLRNLIFAVFIETSANGTTGWTEVHEFAMRPIYAEQYPNSGLPNPRGSRTESKVIPLSSRLRYLRARWVCHDATTGVAEASMTFAVTGVATDA